LTGGRQSSLAISVFLIFRASSIWTRKSGHYNCRNIWGKKTNKKKKPWSQLWSHSKCWVTM